ncbi:hypothetical protein [Streptomyces sp. BBFR102]|uniref:hypothetical protein n=1 Tax=Streptomyces sp. BBFR102 TaxID=3448171 RepID=UPI003F53B8F4
MALGAPDSGVVGSPLQCYLEAVTRLRPSPVHVSVAFNAVYFGYALDGEGYGRSPLRLDDFPVVTLGEGAPALPVGAMVGVTTKSQPLFAELVHKEGAHAGLQDFGEVPSWVSGAPAGAEGPGRPETSRCPHRRELLVLDVDAFGSGLSPSPARLHRWRSQQRWINEDGHVVVDARYPSQEAARRGDLEAYAEYLLTTAREQLLSPLVPVSLAELVGSARETPLREGLRRLLETVRRALATSDRLRMWGPYAVTKESLARWGREPGPLGGDDMRSLVKAVERAAAPSSRRRSGRNAPTTAYTAIGPRLREVPGARRLLSGAGYAAAVCRANLAVADAVRRDSRQGLFAGGVSVGLDDAFEGGGIWRSHYPGTGESGDPLIPAGRGWAATTERDAEPVDVELADEADLGLSELLRSDDAEIVWRQPLRLAHLRGGWLPLDPQVVEELTGTRGSTASVRLEVAYHGEAGAEVSVHSTEAERYGTLHRVTGVAWPRQFWPGLVLQVHWGRASRTLRAVTTRLDRPVRFGDRTVGHCYDPRVLTREDAPGSDRDSDTAVGLPPRQLVLRTVRRCGLLTPDGHALLDRSVLPFAAYGRGPSRAQTVVLETAVEELLAERFLEPATGSRDRTGQPRFPRRTGEPEIELIGYRPVEARVPQPWGGADPQEEGVRGVQYVPGHLRRLLPGYAPSQAQRAAFTEYCRRLGKADGWELPEGYTFVTQHTRGG